MISLATEMGHRLLKEERTGNNSRRRRARQRSFPIHLRLPDPDVTSPCPLRTVTALCSRLRSNHFSMSLRGIADDEVGQFEEDWLQ